MQVDNCYLSLHKRDDITQVSVTSGCPNAARTMTHKRFFAHTNPATQLVYSEPLLFAEGSRGGGGASCTYSLEFVLIGDNKFANLLCNYPHHLTKSQALNAQV